MNRLAASSSPYLLQHAHNPVDWYPWGEEALARVGGDPVRERPGRDVHEARARGSRCAAIRARSRSRRWHGPGR